MVAAALALHPARHRKHRLNICSRLLLALSLATPFAQAASQDPLEAKASDYGCFSCHGMVRKQVGPGFAQIAERYRKAPVPPEQLATKIRNGSVGTWGRVIMPRQRQVSEADAQALAVWVLSQPSPPP